MPTVLARTAREALTTRRLFKYRSLTDDVQVERLRDIVLGNRIRFSKPSELNDPVEVKPIYALGDWASVEYRARFSDWAWNTQKRATPIPQEAAFRTWVLAQSAETHTAHVEAINSENHAELDRKWRILSLSASATHDLMWSHYADGHRGVALVFDASVGDFASAYEVSYAPERETMDITDQDEEKVLRLTALTKRDTWTYEQEFRCIGTDGEEPDTLQLQAQFLHFEPKHLIGVIFGSQITGDNEASIRSWAAERGMPLEFQRAALSTAGAVELQDAS